MFFVSVPWCIDDPVTISNSILTEETLNRTMNYTCKDGYESQNGTDSILVTCSTTDNETIPWTWNDTNIFETLSCTPGENSAHLIRKAQHKCFFALAFLPTLISRH